MIVSLTAADWLAEIYSGIEAADSFLFIISPDSVASKICTLEIEHTVKHNKRLVPVVWKRWKIVKSILL